MPRRSVPQAPSPAARRCARSDHGPVQPEAQGAGAERVSDAGAAGVDRDADAPVPRGPTGARAARRGGGEGRGRAARGVGAGGARRDVARVGERGGAAAGDGADHHQHGHPGRLLAGQRPRLQQRARQAVAGAVRRVRARGAAAPRRGGHNAVLQRAVQPVRLGRHRRQPRHGLAQPEGGRERVPRAARRAPHAPLPRHQHAVPAARNLLPLAAGARQRVRPHRARLLRLRRARHPAVRRAHRAAPAGDAPPHLAARQKHLGGYYDPGWDVGRRPQGR